MSRNAWKTFLAIAAVMVASIGTVFGSAGAGAFAPSGVGNTVLEVTMFACDGTVDPDEENLDTSQCERKIHADADARFYNSDTNEIIGDGSDHQGDSPYYRFDGLTPGETITLYGFEPESFDDFAIGGDGRYSAEGIPQVWLESGYNDIQLYYYNTSDGGGSDPSNGVGTANVTLRLHGCDHGIDPREIDPVAECTRSIDATDAAMFNSVTGKSYSLDGLRTGTGTYEMTVKTGNDGSRVTFSGLEASAYDDNLIIGATARTSHGEFHMDVATGDEITVDVYFYHYD